MSGSNPNLNKFPIVSQVLQPRGQVVINGQTIPWISLEVDNNNFYVADTFKVEFAANYLNNNSINNLVDAPILLVNIMVGYPSPSPNVTSTGMQSLILGQVNDVEYDPYEQVITMTGRDLTQRFIDNKTSEKFLNQTSSDIANTLAQRRGLTPQITETSENVGNYYSMDYSRMTREVSEWDLLTYLARNEQFDVYVNGSTLYFQPPTSSPQNYNIPIKLAQNGLTTPNSNVMSIKFSHNKTLANDVVVKVKSWNMIQAKGFIATSTISHQVGGKQFGSGSSGGTQDYDYTLPNLTLAQAKAKAQQLAQDISSHELLLDLTMPGDLTLTKKSIITVTGTNTVFDTQYYVDSIMNKLSFDGGFEMGVRAKNHSPITQVTL